MSKAQIIVIGSGPAGVSAAWPLVEAGIRVLMIDAGFSALSPPSIDRPDLMSMRKGDKNSWRDLLKSDLSGLRNASGTSPKLRCAADANFLQNYEELNRLETNNYSTFGALAVGGLSNVWGAAVPAFDNTDLEGFPFQAEELSESYSSVAKRIGISGEPNDEAVQGFKVLMQPGIPLAGFSSAFHKRYQENQGRVDFKMTRSRLAVLSQKLGDREACIEDGACMWGCTNGAVYNSAFDVEKLKKRPDFKLISGHLAESLERNNDGEYTLNVRDRKSSKVSTYTANTIVLAAGTLPSTRLVLALQKRFEEDIPFLTSPGLASVFCMPGMLGSPLPEKMLGLSQLSFRIGVDDFARNDAFGLLFDAAAMPAPDLISHMPFTLPAGIKLLRALLPALSIALVYLPGEYGRCRVKLSRDDEDAQSKLKITGGYATDIGTITDKLEKKLAQEFRHLGAFRLPGATQLYQPGAANHHAGTLPMGSETNSFGEVVGFPGLYVVDGSVLSRLPAKNLTFTIMANADRIGRHVAKKC